MKKQLLTAFSLAFIVLALFSCSKTAFANTSDNSRISLSNVLAPGSATLSLLASKFSMKWMSYSGSEENIDGFPWVSTPWRPKSPPNSADSMQFSIGIGIGVFPVRNTHLEGIFQYYSGGNTDFGMGISYFLPMNRYSYLDLGGEAVWGTQKSYYISSYDFDESSTIYYSTLDIDNILKFGGHLGVALLVNKRMSFGFQGFYQRIEFADDYDQDIFGGRFRLLFFWPR